VVDPEQYDVSSDQIVRGEEAAAGGILKQMDASRATAVQQKLSKEGHNVYNPNSKDHKDWRSAFKQHLEKAKSSGGFMAQVPGPNGEITSGQQEEVGFANALGLKVVRY